VPPVIRLIRALALRRSDAAKPREEPPPPPPTPPGGDSSNCGKSTEDEDVIDGDVFEVSGRCEYAGEIKDAEAKLLALRIGGGDTARRLDEDGGGGDSLC